MDVGEAWASDMSVTKILMGGHDGLVWRGAQWAGIFFIAEDFSCVEREARISAIWRGFNADDWDPLVVTDP